MTAPSQLAPKKAHPPILASLLALLPSAAFSAGADLGQLEKQPTNWIAIGMFAVFVAFTLYITYRASQRNKSAADFYTAGASISGFQNGLAIAGDYMSAASFLGISAAVYAGGFDGLIYSVGFLVGWPMIMFLMAERIRNLGRFTFADVASYRFEQRPIRALSAAGTLSVVLFYLIAQMVGAGQLIKLLFGLDYAVAVCLVGVLMLLYVLFGGMTATTWVQIVKAGLLLFGATFMAAMVLARYGFNPEALFNHAISVHKNHDAIMAPGGFLKDPISSISFGMALMFGTAGLPHILMRFFTVPDATQARRSALWATGWIGYFYILTFIIGFGAIVLVGTDPAYVVGGKMVGGANMAAVHLAGAVGGNAFLGFISAVAFATILAVVSGLALSGASAVSHDIYSCFMMRGKPDLEKERKVSKIATVALGFAAVGLGIAFEKQNIAFMVSLAFAIAASANFPVLICSLLWKDTTTYGALAGGATGLVLSVGLTVLSSPIWVDILGHKAAIFPYASPALFSMCAAFAVLIIGSLLDKSERSKIDRSLWQAQMFRSETGIGIETGKEH